METITELVGQLRGYLDPRAIAAAGYLVLTVVVFAETGLAAGFFLSGDSLLVVAGLFAARGDLNIFVLSGTLFVAAVVGDAVSYYSGAKLGPRLFRRQKSLLFRPAHDVAGVLSAGGADTADRGLRQCRRVGGRTQISRGADPSGSSCGRE